MKADKFVVKVASRCNINCTYCYMYNLGDLSYKSQPKFIGEHTTLNFANKLLKHAKNKELKTLNIIIHGGEPLLMPKSHFVRFIETFDRITAENIKVGFSLQTNGILIDDDWCDLFKKYNIGIGISLDGTKEINDRNRVDKKGEGTYDQVVKGIEVLNKNKIKFGILSVLNLDTDPLAYYEGFKEINIKSLDVLFLDMNYDNRKQFSNKKYSASDWYIQLFDIWYRDYKDKFIIRFFKIIIKEILGEEQHLDALGISENNVLVLETDGGLEAVDVLKMCGHGFTKNNLNINFNEIDEVSDSELIDLYYNSGKYLAKKCLACPVSSVCGGGYLPHRYSSINGFNNPSVYCDDLLKIIIHIQNVVIDDLPSTLVEESGISKFTYESVLKTIEENISNIPEPSYTKKMEKFKQEKRLTVLNPQIT